MTPGNVEPTLATKDVAPIIMTDGKELVWEGPVTNIIVANLQVSLFEGQPVLTYWVGPVTSQPNVDHNYGNITFRDTSYNEILIVCPKLGLLTADHTSYSCEADVHESLITSRGTLLFVAHNVTRADLSPIGNPKDGWVYDSLVYDIQPRTGEILFRWSSLAHVPVSATKLPLSTGGQNQSVPLNYFMVNFVVDVGDTYLINDRHTCTVYLVNNIGDILWSLGRETGGDFGLLPPDGHFVSKLALIIFLSSRRQLTSRTVLAALRPRPQCHEPFDGNNDAQQLWERFRQPKEPVQCSQSSADSFTFSVPSSDPFGRDNWFAFLPFDRLEFSGLKRNPPQRELPDRL